MLKRYLYKVVLRNKNLRADFYRYEGDLSWKAFKKSFRNPGFHFTIYLRLSTELSRYSVLGRFSRYMYRKLTFKYMYQIPRLTKIGPGLQISHFGTCLVHTKSVFGSNCYFSHNIAVGVSKRGPKQGVPTVGNRVWIGANAIIMGNIKIGDDVLIAGNSFVNVDVPANSIVLGNPAKIIPRKNATEGYILNVYDGQ